jgi:ribosomal protein L24E
MEEKTGTGEGSNMDPGTGTQQVNNDMTQGNVFRTLLSF